MSCCTNFSELIFDEEKWSSVLIIGLGTREKTIENQPNLIYTEVDTKSSTGDLPTYPN